MQGVWNDIILPSQLLDSLYAIAPNGLDVLALVVLARACRWLLLLPLLLGLGLLS